MCFVCLQQLTNWKDTVWVTTCGHYFCAECLFNAFSIQMVEIEKNKQDLEKPKEKGKKGKHDSESTEVVDQPQHIFCPKCCIETDAAFV